MDSPRRMVKLRKSDMTKPLTPVTPPTEVEDPNKSELKFSKFVSENTDLSILIDSIGGDSLSYPDIDFDSFPSVTVNWKPGEVLPKRMTVAELIDRIYPDLNVSSFIAGMQSESPERKVSKLSETLPKTPKSPKVINPFIAGVVAVQHAWREGILPMYKLSMEEDGESKKKRKREYILDCPCDVSKHPEHWTYNVVQNVHDHSFLLDFRGLKIDARFVIGTNYKRSIVFFNVPMVEGHPWKVKAEQVMRFTDVEMGKGDQTAYNLFYYKQPCDRKIILILTPKGIVGLVVAEKVTSAHRLLKETLCYQDMEEYPVPVRVGINRLWVHVSMRRHQLATLLCDYVGVYFYKGETLKKEDYAFNTEFSGDATAFGKLYVTPSCVRLYKGKTGIKK